MEFWLKLSKSRQPNNEGPEVLKEAVTDELLIAKLGLFSNFADTIKPFLTTYLVDKPIVPFLFNDLFKVLKNVMFVIVKYLYSESVFNTLYIEIKHKS